MSTSGEPLTRVQAARRRAQAAKLVVACAGGASFIVLLPLVKSYHASKPHPQTTALAAPQSFVSAVKADLLQAGIITPPQQPPQVSSSVS